MPDANTVADCPFCAIVDGELEASVVYEDDTAVAFLDHEPFTEGHTLVAPTAHAEHLSPLSESTGGHLFAVGMRVAAALRGSSIPTDGINFLLADGTAAGQEVFHVHLHVIPRTVDDGVDVRFDRSQPDRDHLDAVAATLSESL